MICLGIESSCDETALAVVKDNTKVLASVIASQTKVHEPFGGVVPEIAARQHLETIFPLYNQVLEEAQITPKDIDLLAVSQGPGLIGALLVGVSFAKGLSFGLKKPLQPVNHVHAHVHGALLDLEDPQSYFPALALVVSGGHTNLYYMKSPTEFKLLGYTIDDACGESFDKVAKLLKRPYPGGPTIEVLAKNAIKNDAPKMPKMLADQKDSYLFSYSGLKTHVSYYIKKLGTLTPQEESNLCYSFQEAAFDQIIHRLQKAFEVYGSTAKSVIIAGGVSANKRFKEKLEERIPLKVLSPKLTYCSDNAAMIASCGSFIYQTQKNAPHDSWDAFSRYPFKEEMEQIG